MNVNMYITMIFILCLFTDNTINNNTNKNMQTTKHQQTYSINYKHHMISKTMTHLHYFFWTSNSTIWMWWNKTILYTVTLMSCICFLNQIFVSSTDTIKFSVNIFYQMFWLIYCILTYDVSFWRIFRYSSFSLILFDKLTLCIPLTKLLLTSNGQLFPSHK